VLGAEDAVLPKENAGAGLLAPLVADELALPNMLGWDAPLVVPNMLVGAAAELVVLVLWSPPKGLLDGCAPKMEPPPPKLGAGAVPLVAELEELKGLFPAEKLKPDEGGWGLKVVLWLPAPKAGNDEVVKELLGVEDCAGGKLLVAAPPNMGAPPVGAPPMGAEAPKLKPPDCCGAPKFALCERLCVMTSVRCCCACTRRIARRSAAVYLLDMAGAAAADAGCGCGCGRGWSERVGVGKYSRARLRQLHQLHGAV
jgi:hypothetical protein